MVIACAFASFVARAESDEFGQGSRPLAGTDSRVEVEFKLAYELSDGDSLDEISEAVRKALLKLIGKKALNFEKLMGRDYRLDDSFQAFLFRDIYIDTPDHQILGSGSAYRLRHRWSRYERYLHHRLLPFMKAYFPTRCEIQFKTGYQPDYERQVVTPRETRFEFRNESAPFDLHKDAPETPWPVEEYLGYARTGRYKTYEMKPMADLLTAIGAPRDSVPELKPMIEVLTIRDRIHLNLKHPWGSGPNPEQVFIITLDKSTLGNTYGHVVPKVNLLEMEVEIERNSSTEIHKMMQLGDDDARFPYVKQAAVRYSGEAWQALVDDLDELRLVLAEAVAGVTRGRALPLDYKYARIMGIILEHSTANRSQSASKL